MSEAKFHAEVLAARGYLEQNKPSMESQHSVVEQIEQTKSQLEDSLTSQIQSSKHQKQILRLEVYAMF